MKKLISLLLCAFLVVSLAACGTVEEQKVYEGTAQTASGDDSIGAVVDLTKLSSTMIYSEVNQIMIAPTKYLGKTIKMAGQCALYYNQNDATKTYYTCIINDATACCSQGIEFMLKDGATYPEVYSNITVEGVFAAYEEDGNTYYRLDDASIL